MNTNAHSKPSAPNVMCNLEFSYSLFRLVCASCVMFKTHKGHEVIDPQEAVNKTREEFDKNIKSGKLKVANTETILVDIRQSKVQSDQAKNKTLKEAENAFNELI